MPIEINITEQELLKHTAYYLDKASEGRVIVIERASAPRLRLQMEAEACDTALCDMEQYKDEFRSFLSSLGEAEED